MCGETNQGEPFVVCPKCYPRCQPLGVDFDEQGKPRYDLHPGQVECPIHGWMNWPIPREEWSVEARQKRPAQKK